MLQKDGLQEDGGPTDGSQDDGSQDDGPAPPEPAGTETVAGDFDPSEGHPRRRSILGILCLSLVLVVASVSSLNVAIPAIVRALDATQTEQLWILDAYALVFAGFLLPAGALGDRYGRKGALLVGLAVFGSMAVLGSFAEDPGQVIAVRGAMGIGAALIMPATLSILTTVFPPEERGKAIAVWAGFAGAGGAIGPLASGLLLEDFWWGSVFFVNVPIVIVAAIAIALLVPSSKDPSEAPLDPVGALTSVLGLLALVFGIIEGPEKGWTSALVLGAFVIAAVSLTAFVAWERRSDAPMLDPAYFRNRSFSLGSLTITAAFAVMFGMFYVITLFLQFVQGYTALEAAVRTLPFAVTMIVVSPRGPSVVARIGARRTITLGLVVQAAGFLIASTLRPDTGYAWVALALVVIATGFALLMPASTEAIVSSLPPAKAGVGSAMNDTTREVGGAVGIALMGTLLSIGYRDGLDDVLRLVPAQVRDLVEDSIAGAVFVAAEAPGEQGAVLFDAAGSAFADGLQLAFVAAACVGLTVAAVVFLAHPERRRSRDDAPPSTDAAGAEKIAPPT